MSDDFTLKAEDLDILTEHDETLLFTMFAMLRIVMALGYMVPGDVYSTLREKGHEVPADQDLSDEAQNTRDIKELLELMERCERAGGIALIVGQWDPYSELWPEGRLWWSLPVVHSLAT